MENIQKPEQNLTKAELFWDKKFIRKKKKKNAILLLLLFI